MRGFSSVARLFGLLAFLADLGTPPPSENPGYAPAFYQAPPPQSVVYSPNEKWCLPGPYYCLGHIIAWAILLPGPYSGFTTSEMNVFSGNLLTCLLVLA